MSFIPTIRRRKFRHGAASAGATINVKGVAVYTADAREVLPALELVAANTVVITDPPWPEAPKDCFSEWGIADEKECALILTEVFAQCARIARRIVVILGCGSDPRILTVPVSMPFVRVCWLRLALPSPRGTILNSGDVAYVFGSRESSEGTTLIPGECTATTPRGRENVGASMHPTSRRLEHMRWLVAKLTRGGDTIVDPFCGSGTTLLAARDAGRQSIGIDRIDYTGAIAERFRQQSLVVVS